jgi:hypothetical protein
MNDLALALSDHNLDWIINNLNDSFIHDPMLVALITKPGCSKTASIFLSLDTNYLSGLVDMDFVHWALSHALKKDPVMLQLLCSLVHIPIVAELVSSRSNELVLLLANDNPLIASGALCVLHFCIHDPDIRSHVIADNVYQLSLFCLRIFAKNIAHPCFYSRLSEMILSFVAQHLLSAKFLKLI